MKFKRKESSLGTLIESNSKKIDICSPHTDTETKSDTDKHRHRKRKRESE